MSKDLMTTTSALPQVPVIVDGFDMDDPDGFVGSIYLKFDPTKPELWFDRNGDPVSHGPYCGMDIKKEAIRWWDQKITDRIAVESGQQIDIEKLNADEPNWEPPKFGVSKGPWVLTYGIYMFDPETGLRLISSNSTAGQSAAYYALRSQVKFRRQYVGQHVAPMIRLASAPMKTKWGLKPRPAFDVVGWVNAGGATDAPAITGPTPVAPITAAEVIKDSIPDHPAPKAAKPVPSPADEGSIKVGGAWVAPWESADDPEAA